MLTCYGPGDECCDVDVSGWEAGANTTNVLAFATDTTCDVYPHSTLAVALDTSVLQRAQTQASTAAKLVQGIQRRDYDEARRDRRESSLGISKQMH